MQLLLLVLAASCLAVVQGVAIYASYPYLYTAQGSALFTPTQQQFHTQDELGQYAYGYAEPHSSKHESRSLDGTTVGSYSYRDAAGKLQTVDYTADAAGFHVAATNLPQSFRAAAGSEARGINAIAGQLADTVEVTAARQSHLAAHDAARLRLAKSQLQQQQQQQQHSSSDNTIQHQPDVELPQPVADTAEVAAAKSIHLKRVANEKLRNELLSGAAVSVARSSHVLLPAVYSYSLPHYYSPTIYY